MYELNLKELKATIRDELRNKLMPQATIGTSEFTLSTDSVNYEIGQSFKPHSTILGTMSTYISSLDLILKKYGSPSEGLSVYIESTSNDLPSGISLASNTIVPTDVGTIATTIQVGMKFRDLVGSKSVYWVRIVPNNVASTVDFYSIFTDAVDTNYWIGQGYYRESGSTWEVMNKDIYFKLKTPNWIYTDYPYTKLSLFSYPRIAVDMMARPRVIQRYLTHQISEYYLINVNTVYARYPDEIDELISDIDTALGRGRITLSNIRYISPGNFSEVTPAMAGNIFARNIRFECKIVVSHL